MWNPTTPDPPSTGVSDAPGIPLRRPARRKCEPRSSSRRTTAFTRRLPARTPRKGLEGSGARAIQVRYALHRIPDLTDRSILVLRFFYGLSLDDISEQLLLPFERVRRRYLEGLRRMEEELGGWI